MQDTDPDNDGGRSLIVDTDGPGLVEGDWDVVDKRRVIGQTRGCDRLNPTNIFDLRDNFVTFVVFQSMLGQAPERVSAKRQYTFSADIGFDIDDQAIFLVDPPNDGQGHNEFAFDKQLDLKKVADFGLPRPTIIGVTLDKMDGVPVANAGPPWKLPYAGMITLTVTGTGLAGKFSMIELVPGQPHEVRPTSVVRTYPTGNKNDQFSDITKVEVTFCTGIQRSYLSSDQARELTRLQPSPYPYVLRITTPAGEARYQAGSFVFPTPGAERKIHISALVPWPGAEVSGNQIVTLTNLGDVPVDLSGWQLQSIDLHEGTRATHQAGHRKCYARPKFEH